MPFRSLSQKRFLYAKHPDIAKRWEKLTPDDMKLPEHAPKEPSTLSEYLTHLEDKDKEEK